MLRWLYSKFYDGYTKENKDTNETIEEFCDVRVLYTRFNVLYFEGLLENVSIGWGEDMRDSVGMCVCEGNECKILLNAEILQYRTNRDIKGTIIHEMIHAYLFLRGVNEDDDHGPEFMRLAKSIGEYEDCEITTYHSFHNEVSYLYSS